MKPEKGVDEILQETREREAEKLKTGGMGRKHTPKDGPSEGTWHHDDEHPLDRVGQNEEDSDELPD